MSKTFEVYPRSSKVPSFQELVELGTKRLHQQLAARGISSCPQVIATLRASGTHERLPLDALSPVTWGAAEYLWLSVDGVLGGTDVTCEQISGDDLEYWEDVLSGHPPAIALRDDVRQCLASGVYWSFRRSAGQPAIINFAYGILAAALAELTEGFVYSDDAAWDYERFPAKPGEFYEWYFDPEQAIDPDFAKWARDCVAAIANDATRT